MPSASARRSISEHCTSIHRLFLTRSSAKCVALSRRAWSSADSATAGARHLLSADCSLDSSSARGSNLGARDGASPSLPPLAAARVELSSLARRNGAVGPSGAAVWRRGGARRAVSRWLRRQARLAASCRWWVGGRDRRGWSWRRAPSRSGRANRVPLLLLWLRTGWDGGWSHGWIWISPALPRRAYADRSRWRSRCPAASRQRWAAPRRCLSPTCAGQQRRRCPPPRRARPRARPAPLPPPARKPSSPPQPPHRIVEAGRPSPYQLVPVGQALSSLASRSPPCRGWRLSWRRAEAEARPGW